MNIKLFSYSENGNEKLSEHFSVRDFASATYSKLFTDIILIDLKLIDILEKIYETFKCKNIIICSGYRCAEHEMELKKNGKTFHNDGRAVDICVIDRDGSYISAHKLKSFLEKNDVWGLKVLDPKTLHIDTRIKAMKNMIL